MIGAGQFREAAFNDAGYGFFHLYQANVTRLGGLSPNEAKQIVRFYQLADSVRLDVTIGGSLFEGTTDPDSFCEAADLLEAAMKIGRELTGEATKKK